MRTVKQELVQRPISLKGKVGALEKQLEIRERDTKEMQQFAESKIRELHREIERLKKAITALMSL